MIRAGVLDAPAQTPATDVCPSCDGAGRIVLERIYGPTAAEPYVYGPCYACSGSGEVRAELVVRCTQSGCGAPIWADRACTHGAESPLCGDHANPRCPDCIDDRGGLDR